MCIFYESAKSGAGRWSTILSGNANPFTFREIRVKVDMCRSGTYICHVVRKPQLGLINSNRCASQRRRPDPLTYIVVNKWSISALIMR
jgi:hypothetical protein